MINRGNEIERGEIDGCEYFILRAPLGSQEALNGYCVFKKRPTRETGYNGILTYVPVHGGITYAERDKDGSMVYGFDTLHCDSHEKPRTDPEWIKGQIQVMIAGIRKAAEVEGKYLRCISNKGRAKWAQMVSDIQREESRNFGVMINLLGGEL